MSLPLSSLSSSELRRVRDLCNQIAHFHNQASEYGATGKAQFAASALRYRKAAEQSEIRLAGLVGKEQASRLLGYWGPGGDRMINPAETQADREAETIDEILADPVLLACAYQHCDDDETALRFAIVVKGEYSLDIFAHELAEEYAPVLMDERREDGEQDYGEMLAERMQ